MYKLKKIAVFKRRFFLTLIERINIIYGGKLCLKEGKIIKK